MLNPYIITTNHQKVLYHLVKFSDRDIYERDLARKLGISSGSANRALNDLYSAGVITRRREGKMYFYSINSSNPAIIEFKKIINLMIIEPLIEDIKKIASRIVLYGSCAFGTDTSESDLDLFIITNKAKAVSNAIHNFKFPQGYGNIRIQPVIKTPAELMGKGALGKPFMEEVGQGIVLWEKAADESRV